MIKGDTVFILGAGASNPYGYPTGEQLKTEIIDNYVNDLRTYIRNRTRGSGLPEALLLQESQNAKKFVETFKNVPISIDQFIATNRQFEREGKKAIILRILKDEMNSSNKDDWFSELFKRMTERISQDADYNKVKENKISFITFNYDRSLETFLFNSLNSMFTNIQKEKIIELINKFKIIHIFGQVAGLEWQNKVQKVEYRENINFINIEELVGNIRTIYEEQKNPELEDAKELIKNAKRIFFMGFGYAEENMEILEIPQNINVYTKVYGTMLNYPEEEIKRKIDYFIAKTRSDTLALKNADRFRVGFINTDCVGLLRKFLDDY